MVAEFRLLSGQPFSRELHKERLDSRSSHPQNSDYSPSSYCTRFETTASAAVVRKVGLSDSRQQVARSVDENGSRGRFLPQSTNFKAS